MTVIAIPNVLRSKLGEDGTEAFIEIINKVQEGAKEVTLEIAESRFEKRLAQFEAKVECRLSEFKSDIIKWMIGISISQMVLILSIISVFFRR